MRRALAAVSSAIALSAGPASAHVIAPSYSVFDNGALHAAISPQLMVPLLALGVALGRGSRTAAINCGLLWLAAFFAGALLWNRPGNPLAGFGTPLAFMAAGAALLSPGRLAWMACAAGALIIGVATGGIGRLEDLSSDTPGWFTLGTGCGAALILFFAAEASSRFKPGWLTIPVRIAASWLMAIGLMFLAVAIKPPAPTAPATATNTAADASPCPGPHKHGLDGEFICLPVPVIEGTSTPSSIAKYGNAPPVLSDTVAPRQNGPGAP